MEQCLLLCGAKAHGVSGRRAGSGCVAWAGCPRCGVPGAGVPHHVTEQVVFSLGLCSCGWRPAWGPEIS